MPEDTPVLDQRTRAILGQVGKGDEKLVSGVTDGTAGGDHDFSAPIASQRTRAILGSVDQPKPTHDDKLWDMAGADPQSVSSGVDVVSDGHGTGDLFPSASTVGVMAVALLPDSDADPLVSLPPADFAHDGLEHGDLAHFVDNADAPGAAWDASHPAADHSATIDHIDWHLSGLLS